MSLTPYAGANRIRYEGLRMSALSAPLWRSPVCDASLHRPVGPFRDNVPIENAARPGWIDVRCGGESEGELLQQLHDAGVQLNDHARTLLWNMKAEAPLSQTVSIVIRTVQDLGLAEGGTMDQVFAAAATHGLLQCPLGIGPYLRLAMLDQSNASDSILSAGRAPTDAIHVASPPPSEDVEYPKGFYLRVVDDQPWLRGYRCDETYLWGPEQKWAFALPRVRTDDEAACGDSGWV